MKKTATIIMLLFSVIVFAQSSYNIQFEDEVIRVEENISNFQWSDMPVSSKFENGYYGWIQFFETPKQSVQNDFKRKGLELIEYVPNKAYLFYFSEDTSIQYLRNNGVRAIVPIDGRTKLSAALKMLPYPTEALDGDNIRVTLKFQKHAELDYVINELVKQQISVKHKYNGHNVLSLSIPNNCLEALSNLSFVKWIELIGAPAVPHDTRGKSSQRSNNLDTQTSAGRNYTGAGIGVMVRDFGPVEDHVDFKGRLVNDTNGLENLNHGENVAGIFAGAGNINPIMRGMAAGADIYNVDATQVFTDTQTTSLIYDGTVQITNTSSGFACQNGYTLNAVTLDEQANDLPSLLHVLSAGNANNFDCDYGAGDQWGNLGGANKTSKNNIAAANVTFDGAIVQTSSRGPAADGRIKPDLSAMGNGQWTTDEGGGYNAFGGTSAAAPSIAGVAAQLYEAYGEYNDGALPQSALIKAAMLNTTNEAGNIGPDFIYGWGIVNGLRAVKIIEETNYLSDDIGQGDTNNHVVNVPSGTTQVRFMVYWRDVPGAIGANPALVNDLDLVVTNPANNTLLPWILDSTPDPVALNTPATTGPDHLNNMEQVLINNPAAGDYSLDISGFNVPVGPQEYFVLYEIISDNITVTYPNGGESFVPGSTEVIHWDATNTTEDFDLEYSIDNGVNWISIATAPSSAQTYVWTVPSVVTGAALVRVTSGTFTDTSDAVYASAEQVEGFAFSSVCPDVASFVWDALADAESYDVYVLGEQYMEILGSSTTTSITVPISDGFDITWAAIVAKNDTENWKSLRTIAIPNTGLFNCSLPNDVEVLGILNDAEEFSAVCSGISDFIVSAEFLNFGVNPQNNFEVSYQLSGQAEVTEMFTTTIASGEQVVYNFAAPLSIADSGPYTLTVSTNLIGDENPANDTATLDFVSFNEATAIDFEESFETNGVPPAGWIITNPDDSFTWQERGNITGSDGNITVAAWVDNESYFDIGQIDELQTEIFDLSDASEPMLYFDLAKAQYSDQFNDTLKVDISIDCGITFTTIYEKDGLELSTLPDYSPTNNWVPTSLDHWRREDIDLSSYIGENVIFNFINIAGFSNSTFVDNINVVGEQLGVVGFEIPEILIYPNPATDTVTINGQNVATTSIVIVNSIGQTVRTISSQELGNDAAITMDVSGYSTGLYFVTINSGNTSKTKKLIIK